MDYNPNILIHFIAGESVIARKRVCHVPRPGDEVRLWEKFYTVERIVWVYDEDEILLDRVNIGVTATP